MPRLFIAIYPPPAAAAAMLGLLPPLGLPAHRPTPAEQLHITVLFLAEVGMRDLQATIESVDRAAAGLASFELRPRRLIALPERGWPRLLALETDAPSPLLELHDRLVRRLAQRPQARTRDRFLPHFTLCRFSNDSRVERVEQAVDLPPMEISEVRLMRSDLRPEGARHSVVHAVELAGRGAGGVSHRDQ